MLLPENIMARSKIGARFAHTLPDGRRRSARLHSLRLVSRPYEEPFVLGYRFRVEREGQFLARVELRSYLLWSGISG
jgi:hypothetical protein